MANNSEEKIVKDFLEEKVVRARETFENGNRLGSAYLACIAGMWTNACKRPNRNPYSSSKEGWIWGWFDCGYDALTSAVGQTFEIRKKQIESEKSWEEEQKKKKTSSWNIKLW